MGEYAKYNGQEIKIGTCEQMYYLRADQVSKIQPVRGSVNPRCQSEAEQIRFRFPFPQEDNEQPGGFNDLGYDFGLGLYGVEPPKDIDHSNLQFQRTYPQSGGILLGTPCPKSKEGKASGLHFTYNGYSGPVHIHSQRLVDGKLCLVMRCGDCGALWRLSSLEECQPVLDALEKQTKDPTQANYYREIARRIVAGYTDPNFWTEQPQPVAA